MTLNQGLRRIFGVWTLLVALLVGGTGASLANSLPTTIAVTLSADGITYPATANAEVKLSGVFAGLAVGGQFELWARRFGNLVFIAPYPTGGNTTFPITLDAKELLGATALQFRFSGDNFYKASTTAEIPFTATAKPTTEIFSNSNPSEPGKAVTFTVVAKTLPGVFIVGDANVFRNGELYAKVSLSSGVNNFNVPAEKVAGSWTADFLGNPFQGLLPSSSVAWVQTVKAAKTATTTNVVATPNPVEVGKAVTLTAVVEDSAKVVIPAGTVTFAIDGTSLPPVTLDATGAALLDAGSFALGNRTITASYSGSSALEPSTSAPLTVVVTKAASTTKLAGSAPDGVVPFGAALFVTATVTGAVGDGNVEIRDGSPQKLLGFASTANGTATFDLSAIEPGEHYLTAYFYGNGSTAPAESTAIYYNVVPSDSAATIAASTDHARVGEPVTFTATVAPVAPAVAVPTGTVTFRRGSTVLGTAELAGGGAGLAVAAVDVATLPVGVSEVTVSYDGGVGFKASKSAAVLVTVDLRAGDELPVNTTTKGPQTAPAVATGASGGALVVFESAAADGKDKEIRARLVSAAGVPTGKDVVVAKAGQGVASPAVTGLLNGDYAVVWQAGAVGERDVFLRFVSEAGKPKGNAVVVNSVTDGDQTAPVVALQGAGGFVVAWQSVDADGSGILAQRFDAKGKATGKVIAVNTTTAGDQVRPVATPLDTGGFAIGWSGPLKTGNGAFFQAYTKTGKPRGKEVTVDTSPASALPRLALTVGSQGGVIAAWDEPDKKGSADRNAFVAAFAGTGQKLSPNVQIDPVKKGDQGEPALVPIAGPKLAITWTAADADKSGVSLAMFSVTAARVIPVTPVNTTTADVQGRSVLALLGEGDNLGKTFIAVWETAGQDGSLGGIALQAFGAP